MQTYKKTKKQPIQVEPVKAGQAQTSASSTVHGMLHESIPAYRLQEQHAFHLGVTGRVPNVGDVPGAVKYYPDSPRALQIGARAFTQGNMIHFAPGQYRPDMAEGRRLIGHELAHVVQQRQGRVKANTRFDGQPGNDDAGLEREADASAAKLGRAGSVGLLQTAHAASVNNALSHPIQRDRHKSLAGFRGPKKVEQAPDDRPDPKKEYAEDFFGMISGVADTEAGTTDRGKALRKKENGWKVDRDMEAERVAITVDQSLTEEERTQELEKWAKQNQAYDTAWQVKHGSDVVSGGTEIVSNMFGFINNYQQWRKRDKRKDPVSSAAELAIDQTATATSTMAAGAKVVDSSAKLSAENRGGIGPSVHVETTSGDTYETTASDLAGKMTGNVADFASIFKEVKDLFKSVKSAWDVWHKQTSSGGEKARATIETGTSLMSLAKTSTSLARNLLFTLNNAWHAGLSQAVPGLGIAINAVELVLHGFDLIKAWRRKRVMRNRKGEQKQKLGDGDTSEALNHETIARKRKVLEDKVEGEQSRREKARLNAQLANIDEYELWKELQTVNEKRVNRQALNLTTDLAKIAGDVSILSGVGSTAGVGFKAGAATLSLGARAVRGGKQWARDKGLRGFDQNKTTEKKDERRDWIADQIYNHLDFTLSKTNREARRWLRKRRSPTKKRRTILRMMIHDSALEEDVVKLRDMIKGTGMSWKSWKKQFALNFHESKKMIVEVLKKRN